MHLGAMVDLGVDPVFLISNLEKLGLHGYTIRFVKGQKHGITGTKAIVEINEHHHHHTEHHHRTFEDIRKIILGSSLNETVKELSINIFYKVAEAEAKVHDKPVDKIHFHEVGAIDSIVDIVGAAICIDFLKPDKILASTVELGGGFVNCAHGTFPVPAPATAEILKGIPIRTGTVQSETTTPTGAAILAACVNEFTDTPGFIINKTGYGLGERDLPIPNLLRIYFGEIIEEKSGQHENAIVVDCNIDDMNPEFYDYIFESLFKAGANDVYITPIIMKKSRPAVKLSTLCNSNTLPEVERILLRETSTLGIRKYMVDKTMLNRSFTTLETPYGKVKIKEAYYNDILAKSKPEYEDCLRIAREQNIPLNNVYKMINELLMKVKEEK